MNKHKTLRKTKNFQCIRLLLCIVPLFVPSCAKITYDEAKFQIFHKKATHFESEILKSLQTTRNFFAQPEFASAVLLGLAAGTFFPPLAPTAGIVFVIRALLAQESDWRGVFSEAIARETNRAIAVYAVDSMASKMKTISKKLNIMNDNSTDIQDRKIMTYFVHSEIENMLNFFDGSHSIFKRFPLIATPLLIELAQLIAFFDPVAKAILKKHVKNADLSCLMHNILLDYRPRFVNDRMEKVHSVSRRVPELLSFAMEGAYYPHGYSITIPPSFNCKRCSAKSKHCLNDDFGDTYDISESPLCVKDYALFVRHRVEEMVYPVVLVGALNHFCSNPTHATGTFDDIQPPQIK